MATRTVTVDGYTYEGRWLSSNKAKSRRVLHVTGPLEYKRPVRGSYRQYDGSWMDGPTGRSNSARSVRWWKAAQRLVAIYNEETLQDE